MIYTKVTAMDEVTQETSSGLVSLPTTVIEIASSCTASSSTATNQSEDAITVLDLSNPSDVALVTDAGYSILDLSASMASTTSEASSDTISIATDDYMSDLDPEIAKAAAVAKKTGSLIPLLKEELKYNIQRKRLQEGKDILKVERGTRKREHEEELSMEEEEKRSRRRARNKVAAQKCRSKRKARAEILEEESVNLEEANEDLKHQIEELENEKEMLRNMLRTHDVCPRSCNIRLSTGSEDEAGPGCQDKLEGDDLDVQMELEISQVESPFSVHLMGVEPIEDEDQEQVVTNDIFYSQ